MSPGTVPQEVLLSKANEVVHDRAQGAELGARQGHRFVPHAARHLLAVHADRLCQEVVGEEACALHLCVVIPIAHYPHPGRSLPRLKDLGPERPVVGFDVRARTGRRERHDHLLRRREDAPHNALEARGEVAEDLPELLRIEAVLPKHAQQPVGEDLVGHWLVPELEVVPPEGDGSPGVHAWCRFGPLRGIVKRHVESRVHLIRRQPPKPTAVRPGHAGGRAAAPPPRGGGLHVAGRTQ
mmetsp:Transcript_21935/g.55428  ORF Transcript_21935/g.55428 Transcript_21935/m.55428 type:complete len:239 (-) Transcript_21935:81-797(-)